MSRLSRGEDKPSKDPTPGLLGTMAGGAAVSLYLLVVDDVAAIEMIAETRMD